MATAINTKPPGTRAKEELTPSGAFAAHWPEYLIEAAALGAFMVSACIFAVLLGHPGSGLYQALDSPLLRQSAGGLAMGATALAIISSPWGKRSGAHMNPAITVTFLALGKIRPWDALFYVAAQFIGGLAGVGLSYAFIGAPLTNAAVNFAATLPGPSGELTAFWAEFAISAVMMGSVLAVSNSARYSRFTPWVAGSLVAAFITFESPFSGMSMNPARTVASAVPAHEWAGWWIYFAAPVLGMGAAAFVYRVYVGAGRVYCAKLDHQTNQRCIFNCNYGALHADK